VLFGFRGIRSFQVLLAFLAVVTGVGAVLAIKGFADSDAVPLLFVALLLGLVFLWAFATALRAPTSFVAVAPERTRIRFAGFVDTVVDNGNIAGAALTEWRMIVGGIGVRTNFKGRVGLVCAGGPAAELTFREPIRVWAIPKLIPMRAERLVVSVRNPEKLVERFGPVPATASPPVTAERKMKRRGSRAR
jgi:hypothetical protein